MADWTDIPDSNLAPGAPARSAEILAIRDNVTAQAEGAVGAPKTKAAALDETLNERDWVNGRTAESSAGAVGTYAMLYYSAGATSTGTVRSGNLFYAAAGGASGSAAGGTWRCMGITTGGSLGNQTTIWLRIS